jgi:hypothetical protein
LLLFQAFSADSIFRNRDKLLAIQDWPFLLDRETLHR